MNLLIKNGHLLDPASGYDEIGDLYVSDGKIADRGMFSEEKRQEFAAAGTKVIDAAGKYVMPGFVDLHVHLREPGYEYKETIKTGTMAAAKAVLLLSAQCQTRILLPIVRRWYKKCWRSQRRTVRSMYIRWEL